jgi:hypothetical protein
MEDGNFQTNGWVQLNSFMDGNDTADNPIVSLPVQIKQPAAASLLTNQS